MLGTAFGAVMFGNAVSVWATIIAGCVLSFFNLGAYGAIIALTPSLYRVKTRGTMTGLAEGMGRFGAVVGPLLVGFLMDKGFSINSIFILFMVSLIVGAIAVLALPDENLSKDGQNHAEWTACKRKISWIIETIDELKEAIDANVDVIVFDNQLPQTIRKWKEMVPAHVKVEASGGISLSTIASFKGCGADFLSMGELTNEVEPLDISFLVKNAVKAEF